MNLLFFQQISNEQQRQDIANHLLCQLHKLDQPIGGDTNWSVLFIIVDPVNIKITHLNLVDSFKAFITCIEVISTVLTNNTIFEEQIDDYFDDRLHDKSGCGSPIPGNISK